MFKTSHARHQGRRRGMILMVVLALLTLFAIVGISFVYVAQGQETSARIAREAETMFRPQINPEAAFAYALGQLIYDCNDTDGGVYSGLRGYSLARNMYGWNDTQLNDKPYTGHGRLSYDHPVGAFETGKKTNDIVLMNYTYHGELKIRDPERYPLPDTSGNPQYRTAVTDAHKPDKQPYIPTANVPYTYPDHNNYYLAVIDPFTGSIVAPSFHREYLFPLSNTSHTDWTSQIGKYKTVRPTNNHHANFPKPIDANGDVKNLDGVPGGADSIWIDIGAPVMTAPQASATAGGKPLKYKMLIAPLILDLDSRVNLNVVGNLMGGAAPNQEHRSNQGWGAWEINPQKVLNDGSSTNEWRSLFQGSSATGQARYPGRYDTNNGAPMMGQPDRQRVPLGPKINGTDKVRGWAQVDFNGTKDDTAKGPSDKYALPKQGTASAYFGFPDFTTSNSFGNGGTTENPDHASIYWPFNPRVAASPDQGNNRKFPIKDMVRILRDGGTGSDMLASDVRALLRGNLWTTANAARRRNLVTLHSADLDRPGAMPWVWDPYAANTTTGLPDSAETRYQLRAPVAPSLSWTLGGNKGIPFPDPAGTYGMGSTYRGSGAPDYSEFDKGTWRNNLAALNGLRQRVNLNRPLYPYPKPDDTTGKIDLSDTTTKDGNGKTIAEQLTQANDDRKTFASDLFNALRAVTGAGEPKETYTKFGGASSAEFRALRMLAQLAANIVDYLDSDDYMTRFQWCNFTSGTTTVVETVFGFELPRLVLNETYVQYDNDLSARIGGAGDQVDPAVGKYNVNVWAELMNPVPDDSALSTLKDSTARLAALDGTGGPLYPMYRLLICEQDLASGGPVPPPPLRDPDNVLGDPNWKLGTMTDRIKAKVETWDEPTAAMAQRALQKSVVPATDRYRGTATKNEGFYVVGPDVDFLVDGDATHVTNPNLPLTLKSAGMNYKIEAKDPLAVNKPRPTVVLQRLAYPPLPLQDNPSMPNYNPWVTVDFVEHTAAMVEDGRWYDTTGARMPDHPKMEERQTVGRTQPYAAALTQRKLQTPPAPAVAPAMPSPKNTFYRQNTSVGKDDETGATTALNTAQNAPTGTETTLKLPFDWLVHIDRKPIGPLELLHVTASSPHLVTQDFVTAAGLTAPANQHVMNGSGTPLWLDQSSRLYRLLEFVSVPPRGTGQMPFPMDRVLGRININNVWNRDVFRALADAQQGNVFYDAANTDTPPNRDKIVDDMFARLMTSRTPNAVATSTPGDYYFDPKKPPELRGLLPTDGNLATALRAPWTTGKLDRPFWGLGIGFGASTGVFGGRKKPGGLLDTTGLADTLLRKGATGADLLLDVPDLGGTTPPYHPYQKKELLTKIFSNVTTRSNVFAVWLTVGFFEVVDDAATPPKLGKEVGKDENRHVRYRMFAIVDRTHLAAFETVNKATFPNTFKAGEEMDVNLGWDPSSPTVKDTRTDRSYKVDAGTILVYEPGSDYEETVIVYGASPNFKARFQYSHPNNCRVVCRGNPGPWKRYDPRKDADVVPYFMLID